MRAEPALCTPLSPDRSPARLLTLRARHGHGHLEARSRVTPPDRAIRL